MRHLGRYKLERVIGRGAMGIVYEGWDEKLKRKVAVKTILKNQLLDSDMEAEYTARFILEAQNAGQLIHPNIVTAFDVGNEADVAYLVMEFIYGKDLKSYLDAGHQLGIVEAVLTACQLLEALDYVHGKGIFHRDIKPANVMLESGTNRVRLTDFGVARMLSPAAPEGSEAGTMVGTPSFMSPEQIKGLPAGAAADLFATGVLLYQCLTLHKPFAGKSEWEIWQRIVNEDPAPMSKYRAGIPPALEHAVQHALAKDPRHRPPSVRALIDELKEAIGVRGFDPDATCMIYKGSPHRGSEAMQVPQPARPDHTSAQRQQLAQDHAIELEFWRSIKDSGDPEELRLYLARYPGGHYADLARRRIAKLAGLAAHPAAIAGEQSDTLGRECPGLPAQALLPHPRPWQEDDAGRRDGEELAREHENQRIAAQEQASKLAKEAARLAAEATQRSMTEAAAWKAVEEAARKGTEEQAAKAAHELEGRAAEGAARRPAEKQAALRKPAQNAVRKAAVCWEKGLALVKLARERIRPAAEAARARLARHGPALAPDAPEHASAAADEVIMEQLRAQRAAPAAPASWSSANWTFPSIFFSERWHPSPIGFAGSFLVSAAILLAIAWLFKGPTPPAAPKVLPFESAVSNGTSPAQPFFPVAASPLGADGQKMGTGSDRSVSGSVALLIKKRKILGKRMVPQARRSVKRSKSVTKTR